MTKIQTVAKTHVGRVRDHNEDTFIVGLEPEKFEWVLRSGEAELGEGGAVFVVADGMGGENAGEIASEIAVQSIRAFIHTEAKKGVISNVSMVLESSLIFAHNKIREACKDNSEYAGMGTTATVCMIRDQRIYISWIGDTRVYRFSPHGRIHSLQYHYKNLDILNEDHSKVWQMVKGGHLSLEEARTHQESNIITQSLGDLFRAPYPDSRVYPMFKDDYILICSDGLNGMLSDETLEGFFSSSGEQTLDELADKLINEANKAGGHDNITLILVKVLEGETYNNELINSKQHDKSFKTDFTPAPSRTRMVVLLTGLLLVMILSYMYRNKLISYIDKSVVPLFQTKRDTMIQNDSIPERPDSTKHEETPKPSGQKPKNPPNPSSGSENSKPTDDPRSKSDEKGSLPSKQIKTDSSGIKQDSFKKNTDSPKKIE